MKAKVMFIVFIILLLALPAQAQWRPCYYPVPYRFYNCPGLSPGAAGAIAGAGVIIGLVAVLLIGKALTGYSGAEQNMLDAAARANQYENYVIGIRYYNANSRNWVVQMTKEQWFAWRTANNLEALK